MEPRGRRGGPKWQKSGGESGRLLGAEGTVWLPAEGGPDEWT